LPYYAKISDNGLFLIRIPTPEPPPEEFTGPAGPPGDPGNGGLELASGPTGPDGSTGPATGGGTNIPGVGGNGYVDPTPPVTFTGPTGPEPAPIGLDASGVTGQQDLTNVIAGPVTSVLVGTRLSISTDKNDYTLLYK
jgi:hypothetical protein